MRALGIFQFGGPEKLVQVELPMPAPGPGEVRIRVLAAAVNPTDILFREGSQAARLAGRPPPYVPGMEASGIVDALGPGADGRLAVGDLVIALVLPSSARGGAYAEYIVAPSASVVALPAGASAFSSTTLLLNGATAWLALDALRLEVGQLVGITGAAGAVGGYAVQLARSRGLRVLADAGSPEDADLVRSLGAHEVVPRGAAFVDAVRASHPAGVAGLVDGAHLDGAVAGAVADGGAFATLRGWSGPAKSGVAIHRIAATAEAENTALFEELRRLATSGALTLRVADAFPARDARAAHRRLQEGGVRGRLVLDLGPEAWS